MGLEIERKWLVDLEKIPTNFIDESKSVKIRQGYVFSNENSSLRVRESDLGWRQNYYVTIKVGSGLVRTEIENIIDKGTFEALWEQTIGSRIEKIRFVNKDIELDFFEGDCKGLIVVEIEFLNQSAALAFNAPDWFGKEVTCDGEYTNAELSKKGWKLNGTD